MTIYDHTPAIFQPSLQFNLQEYNASVRALQQFPTAPCLDFPISFHPDQVLQQSWIEHPQPWQPATSVRNSRSTSFTSCASSDPACTVPTKSHPRAESPATSMEMSKYGHKNDDETWRCAYPRCTSKAAFYRACDLRKHFNRHKKILFCRHSDCPQSKEDGLGGFSSKKDLARHEASHDPRIACEWLGCPRVFSRMDNMVSLG